MAELINALRDIEFTKRYLNDTSMAELAKESGVTAQRMTKIITSAAVRARAVAKRMGRSEKELDLMFLPATLLRQKREYVLGIIDIHEKELKKGEGDLMLDDAIISLHLPSRTHNCIKDKFATIRDLIVYLNVNEGVINIPGLSNYSKTLILQTLAKYDLAKWLDFKPQPTLPEVLQEMLTFIDNPSAFTVKEKLRLQKDVKAKLEIFKNYRRY